MNTSKDMDGEKTILFYPTGVVHFRNLEILKKHLPGFRFRVVVEPWVKEKAPEVLDRLRHEETVFPAYGGVRSEVWQETDILFLSMAYPNLFRLHMVYEAVKRNIPVIAIEEVNQLALNDGIINHYFLHLDFIGVASQVEKDRFVELGLSPDSIHVTGWPFFDEEAALKSNDDNNLGKQYEIPENKKICLLILGSLKERDMVSLESQRVRWSILDTVTRGLTPEYQLLIKPHPIETEEALEEIRLRAPDAAILGPKHPIEPLLMHASLVVNRGNSQVALLALMKQKPVVIVPAGLHTVFHEKLESVIADSPEEFTAIVENYNRGQVENYIAILDLHFPIARNEALDRVNKLFTAAAEAKSGSLKDSALKMYYISILYAFLGDRQKGERITKTIMTLVPEDRAAPLLAGLYQGTLTPVDFEHLLERFPGKMVRWHLQVLYIRQLYREGFKGHAGEAVKLLEGFDGDVNPHYFIDDIVKRIELEFKAGYTTTAKSLLEKFRGDYGVFDYYRQAFDMLEYVYQKRGGGFWKMIWLLANLDKGYTRKFLKTKLFS